MLGRCVLLHGERKRFSPTFQLPLSRYLVLPPLLFPFLAAFRFQEGLPALGPEAALSQHPTRQTLGFSVRQVKPPGAENQRGEGVDQEVGAGQGFIRQVYVELLKYGI